MKNIKVYALAFVLLLTGSTAVFGQRPEFTEIVTKNIEKSLENDLNGIVEASIFNSIFLKDYYPEADIESIVKELNNLALNGKTASIRYKAQIAALYISYRSEYGMDVNLKEYKNNSDKLFKKISEELDNRLLVSQVD